MTHPPTVQTALDKLREIEDQLDPFAQITLVTNTLRMGRDDGDLGPQLGETFLTLHGIVNSGATPDRLDTLVRIIRAVDPDIRRTLLDATDKARETAGSLGERAVWTAVHALVLAVDKAP